MAALLACLPGLWICYLSLSHIWEATNRLHQGDITYEADPEDPETGGNIPRDRNLSFCTLGLGLMLLAVGVLGYLFVH